MDVVTRAHELRGKRAKLASPVGFVATMGALHAGHASLITRARQDCASVVVSVFVNPLQFGPSEDFSAYPRRTNDDRQLLERLGADILYSPDASEMYPNQPEVLVEPTTIAQHFEGERRPGHFRGVATVVLKLFHLVEPHRAYFGEKDAQQLAVIKRMVSDLDLRMEIVACPTLREPDGLALSSRNAYLSTDERRAAPNLYAALRSIADQLVAGQRDVATALASAQKLLEPLQKDYLGVVRPDAFLPLETAPAASGLVAVGAAYAGRTRLIDNVKVQTPADQEMVQG
ncbi:MAG: pantoate--beta-alanine ligase [Candidatus Eremiobacteraeota bacterium]|nr:pantoate--beta-alanine ligase [Candidatus Eremiobacteraeota bacterium]